MSAHSTPRLAAAVALLGRTGARDVQIRYSDDVDPVIWFVVARYKTDGGDHHETSSALTPEHAVLRLCERVIDGGVCRHCARMTVFLAEHTDAPVAPDQVACHYQWDPELSTFRRSCEGAGSR